MWTFYRSCSPKEAILSLFRENSKCVYTGKTKIRLRATLDFTTYESPPPCPGATRRGALRAPAAAPPLRGGSFVPTRKSSHNFGVNCNMRSNFNHQCRAVVEWESGDQTCATWDCPGQHPVGSGDPHPPPRDTLSCAKSRRVTSYAHTQRKRRPLSERCAAV